MSQRCLLVLGMHRSGTSAVARVVNLLGVDFGHSFILADPDTNAKGFWEHLGIVEFHDRLLATLNSGWDDPRPLPPEWCNEPEIRPYRQELAALLSRDFGASRLWGIKDPRLCRLLPLWREVLAEIQVPPSYLLVVRHPAEVASSLTRRDGLTAVHGVWLWLEHLYETLRATSDSPRLVVIYERLLGDWRGTADLIAQQLGIEWPAPLQQAEHQIEQFLDRSLRHHHSTKSQSMERPIALAQAAYEAVIGAYPDTPSICRALDPFLSEFEQMRRDTQPWIDWATHFEADLEEAQQRVVDLEKQVQDLQNSLDHIHRSFSWKAVQSLRPLAGVWRFALATRQFANKGLALAEFGVRQAWIMGRSPRRGWKTLHKAFTLARTNGLAWLSEETARVAASERAYSHWIGSFDSLRDSDRQRIREIIRTWPNPPLISVLLPVYAPPERLLRRAIESVLKQIYPYWELCIADDLSPSPTTRRILEEYRAKDDRIRVTYRSENGHISRASNSALDLATGAFIALLDHDDEFAEHALFLIAREIVSNPDAGLVYSDEDKINEDGHRFDPYFKPDWNPDLLRSQNYISHLGVYRADLVRAGGGFRPGFEGSQDWDLALRITERLADNQIRHVPHVLYHWRTTVGSTALGHSEKGYVLEASKKTLSEHLVRMNLAAEVMMATGSHFRVRYRLPSQPPSVTIIIPTRNQVNLLRQCISSVRERTEYGNLDILVVDNESDDPETLDYLSTISAEAGVTVLPYPYPFNFSAINNFAVRYARGEIVALINNDVEVDNPDWLEELVSHAVRPRIGAVGALLFYPDGTIQHGGTVLGMGGVAGHAYHRYPRGTLGYFSRAALIQNLSAVTAACLAIRKSVYQEVGGMDERNLPVAFNDIDFCLRVQAAGYRNLWTPFASLFHYESATRGRDDLPETKLRFLREKNYMLGRWGALLQHDPTYNPNLSLQHSFPRATENPRVLPPWLAEPVSPTGSHEIHSPGGPTP